MCQECDHLPVATINHAETGGAPEQRPQGWPVVHPPRPDWPARPSAPQAARRPEPLPTRGRQPARERYARYAGSMTARRDGPRGPPPPTTTTVKVLSPTSPPTTAFSSRPRGRRRPPRRDIKSACGRPIHRSPLTALLHTPLRSGWLPFPAAPLPLRSISLQPCSARLPAGDLPCFVHKTAKFAHEKCRLAGLGRGTTSQAWPEPRRIAAAAPGARERGAIAAASLWHDRDRAAALVSSRAFRRSNSISQKVRARDLRSSGP